MINAEFKCKTRAVSFSKQSALVFFTHSGSKARTAKKKVNMESLKSASTYKAIKSLTKPFKKDDCKDTKQRKEAIEVTTVIALP